MDESLFRQLLSRSTHAVLDQPTLAKGADYLRHSRVREIWYESADDSGTLFGAVQGREHEPYTAAIMIGLNGGKPKFDTQCTCPLEGECKHVAAVALKMLGARASAFEPGKPMAVASTGPAAWKPWFDALNADPRPSLRKPVVDPALVFGILLRIGDGTLPGLQAQPVWLKPTKRGGLGSPQPVGQFQFGADPWQRLSPRQFEHVARLRMASPHFASSAWYPLSGERDEALLEILIREYPCFVEKPSRGRVSLGDTRTLDWGWQLSDDGNQKLVPQLTQTDANTRLLRIAQIWYFDPAKPAIGRVQGDAQVIDAALRAPALLPEHADFVVERWHKTRQLEGLPKPAKAVAPQTHQVLPTPVLTLRAFPVLTYVNGAPNRYQAGCVRLSFDYAGPRLPFAPIKPRERRMHEGRLLDIVRDRSAEIAACEQLEELGLIDIDLLPRMPNLPRDVFADGDFVLEPRRGVLIAAEHLFALAPRLRDHGFRLETDSGFPFELLEEPDDWYAEVEESGTTWFDLSLGIEIAGERVDLLPILRRLLGDPNFPLSPRKGEDADALWLVPIDDRRRVPLPLSRLRELMGPLLEWLQDMPERDAEQGALRLRRSQASVLDELSARSAMPWRGGENLRQQLARLLEAREPALEPPGFKATLRAYQRDGLAWLGFLADAGLGGVLADDMGLGKTVQVLAHLLAEKQRGHLDRPVLIVAPTSLVSNWRDEAQRFAPDLSVLVLHGPARGGLHEAIPHHDLVITTYPLLARDRDELLAHEYALLVLDESQVVKNAKSQAARIVREISARRRLAMTGTPLENHLGELWAQFDAVEPGLLGTDRHFTRFYRTPIEKHDDVDRRERLSRRIAPLLLRRRKEDVLADLPEKTFIPRNVELDGAQRELYETLRLAQHERVLAEVQKRGLAQSGIIVLDALLKLRQACCDPRLVKLEGARRIKESAKLELLLELTDSLVAEGRRILVFSQFAEMLDLIAKALTLRKQKFQMLTGQTPSAQRAELVARFQAEQVPIFLISLKAGGVGLNLTAADTVIHYDPWWNPAVEAQATDRAHRIGQDKPVFVYKLICTGTVEEKIQALQLRKAELAAAVLEGGSTQSLRFDEDDLAELFAPL
ncbi:MAG: DEAD/DEAH box helicase [Dokdonella sp.]|uniref:SNF2-related protein n=3 Tax=Dokdonella sp. TaxID=2291710 RepID=UPI002B89C744|nr:DEAD/DEAH box helicase [Xanthomonadales bacterium]HQV73266.1 DEAD/DEAH box helicase [Dokdonella sp.]MBL0223579.1 DEAD/DEAH box helicase [Xanthomonadales bacterium]HQW76310.1 DEAD/DEAH box helicase [Dokdonella sp.]HQY54896.1 DEAD/DEAH box helicase [Dokdonella sp.]